LIYASNADIYGTKNTVTLRFGLEFPGPDCHSISRDFVLHQGKIRPKPGECRVGNAGKYAVDRVGNYEGDTVDLWYLCREAGGQRGFGGPMDIQPDGRSVLECHGIDYRQLFKSLVQRCKKSAGDVTGGDAPRGKNENELL
jgi:hypothetical protein